jgi:hypothetical protein
VRGGDAGAHQCSFVASVATTRPSLGHCDGGDDRGHCHRIDYESDAARVDQFVRASDHDKSGPSRCRAVTAVPTFATCPQPPLRKEHHGEVHGNHREALKKGGPVARAAMYRHGCSSETAQRGDQRKLNSESAKFAFQRQYIVPPPRKGFTATSCGAVLAPTRASPDPNASTLLRELGEGQPPK